MMLLGDFLDWFFDVTKLNLWTVIYYKITGKLCKCEERRIALNKWHFRKIRKGKPIDDGTKPLSEEEFWERLTLEKEWTRKCYLCGEALYFHPEESRIPDMKKIRRACDGSLIKFKDEINNEDNNVNVAGSPSNASDS